MISLIVTLAVVGFLVWIITTYIPMNEGFKKAIVVVAIICVILYLLQAFGIRSHDIGIPRLQ